MGKSNRFLPEVRERALRMVLEHRGKHPSQWATIESIAAKIGMFSYSGLSKDQMVRLRNEFGVYGPDSECICVAALNSHNLDYVCQAIAKVM